MNETTDPLRLPPLDTPHDHGTYAEPDRSGYDSLFLPLPARKRDAVWLRPIPLAFLAAVVAVVAAVVWTMLS